MIVDIDGVLVLAHSEKQDATATWKKAFGHHPLVEFVKGGQLTDLELRHRKRARCKDRIRNTRDTGLRNLPPHASAQNQIGLAIVSLKLDLLAWMPMLALSGENRRWEPKRLRLRLFSAAAQLVNTACRRWLRLSTRWPWTPVIANAMNRLHALPNPD